MALDPLMEKKLEAFFSPYVSLKWRRGKWYPNRIADRALVEQFMNEAGLDTKNGLKMTDADLDKFSLVASNHGYSTETVGYPEDQ